MQKPPLFFDHASTTLCCPEATHLVQRYAEQDYGNPSSIHALGQAAFKAIREAKEFFGEVFGVSAEQVIFTGSGTEANNLALYGVATAAFLNMQKNRHTGLQGIAEDRPLPRVLVSAIEHPSVLATADSFQGFLAETQVIPVDAAGQIVESEFLMLLTPRSALISIQQVNNIIGSVLPVEELARKAKQQEPRVLFHTDGVQAFGKIPVPRASSMVDMVSLSAHKIGGPKGVGALILLNKKLLKTGLRPLIWGGGQEGGFRSGTQNAGLIAGFHVAAKKALSERDMRFLKVQELRARFENLLQSRSLIDPSGGKGVIRWNSPPQGIPHIVNLSIPQFPRAALARLLEEAGCFVSVGSACHARKTEPDPVLAALGLPISIQESGIRISFSHEIHFEDLEILVNSLSESIKRVEQLLGKSLKGRN